jgi:hypothetical protein
LQDGSQRAQHQRQGDLDPDVALLHIDKTRRHLPKRLELEIQPVLRPDLALQGDHRQRSASSLPS